MSVSSNAPNQVNKVVVAFLDGRRVKGFVYNFSAARDSFSVFPREDSPREAAVEVKMKDLKAVFFVKDFVGNPEYRDSSSPAQLELKRGRKIEVTFADGEKLPGTTEAYHPQKLGFFLFPADPGSNNIRVFVVNKNVRHCKFL